MNEIIKKYFREEWSEFIAFSGDNIKMEVGEYILGLYPIAAGRIVSIKFVR
jgi:hypothetical protein